MPGGVEPSNLDKVFWPEKGLTKGDLIAYFQRVAACIVPAIRDRPLTVKRYPDGIHGFSFFQKNAPKYAPPWVRTVTLPAESAKRDVNYILCNSERTLLWLANQGSVEVDVSLPNELPRGARPDLTVEGTIEIEKLANVLFVGRPAGAQPEGQVELFKLTPDGEAHRVKVRLGRSSVSTVEIVDG